MTDSGRALAALAIGLAAGVAARALALGPAEAATLVIEPIGILWSNAIRLSVIPLVGASILLAVLRAKDFGAFGRAGSIVLLVAVGLLAFAAAASLLLGSAVLNRAPVGGGTLETLRRHYGAAPGSIPAAPSLGDWFTQLVPANPFQALAGGVILPIATAALAFAAAARRIASSSRRLLEDLAEAVTDVSFVWIRWMLRVAPIGIFALVFSLVVRTGGGIAVALAYYLAVTVALCIVVGLVLYALAGLSRVVSVPGFARAALTAQLVGFSSRSSMAALPVMIDATKNRLRLPDEVSHAILPMLGAVYRVAAAIVICTGIVFVAWLYGVTLRADQLVTVGLMSIVLGIAMPGVPGAGVLATAPVLSSVGLPAEAVAILLAVDAVGDMFRTATNVTAHLALSVMATRILGRRQQRLS